MTGYVISTQNAFITRSLVDHDPLSLVTSEQFLTMLLIMALMIGLVAVGFAWKRLFRKLTGERSRQQVDLSETSS